MSCMISTKAFKHLHALDGGLDGSCEKVFQDLQGGPKPVVNGVLAPISRVITVYNCYNPSYPFITPFNAIYNHRRGPPCTGNSFKFTHRLTG